MALDPVVVAVSGSGQVTAARVARVLGARLHGRKDRVSEADVEFADALIHVRDLFAAGIPVVGVCAAGILIRAVAPLLADKTTEPPVVAVSDDGSVVVPLLGGHRGANRLARDISEALGARAAVTTAGDIALGIALDSPPPGWRLANPGDAKAAMAILLSGAGVRLEGPEAYRADWLKELPSGDGVRLTCAMRVPEDLGPDHLCFVPLRASLGVGSARRCPQTELAALVDDVLSEAGVSREAVAAVSTLDLKADERAMTCLARELNVPLRLFSAEDLDAETARVSDPSEVVYTEVGTHSVAEASALVQGGPDSALRVGKRKRTDCTAALALAPEPITELAGQVRGRLSVVGIGPGQSGWRTPEVSRLVADAEELVGYGLYIDLLGPLANGKARSDFPLGGEEARCRYALERAAEGRNVALVCSGDAGIYAMAALVFELMDRGPEADGVTAEARRVEVLCSPGVTAMQAAANRAGAPLGHDFCAISLSDLLTPREDILRRVRAAAEGDFVVGFYNPVSRTRRDLLAQARDLLLERRPGETPVLLARELGRPGETLTYRRLDELRVDEVDMLTVVLVGSSHTRMVELGDGPRMYTPRGYARRIDGDLAQGRG